MRLRTKLGSVLLFVLLVGGSVGAGAVMPDSAEIRGVDVRVSVNEGYSNLPEGDGAYACTSVGPPPGMASVSAVVDLRQSTGWYVSDSLVDDSNRVEVSLAEGSETVGERVDVSASRVRVLGVVPGEEYDPGETVTVTVRVLDDGTTIAETTRDVTVQEGGRVTDCEE